MFIRHCNGSVFDAIDAIKIISLYIINNNDIASLNKMSWNVCLLFYRNSIIELFVGFPIFRKKFKFGNGMIRKIWKHGIVELFNDG